MGMKERIGEIHEAMVKELLGATSTQNLEDIRVRLLGKKGELTALLRGMGQLSPDERPKAGQMINEARAKLTEMLEKKAEEIKAREQAEALERETIDVTQPAQLPSLGGAHPINMVMDELIECFTGMGFEVLEGPEVELDHYNFELMNIPKNHPARDAQDTFYVDDNIVLRTHTSPGQIRVMDMEKPPIKVLVPGRVFRSDSDATHSPMFHQMEGLVVDKGITLCDLQGMLDRFVQQIFDADVKTRLRPSYFPFTEPSVEVDVSCFECGGKGCSLCKHTGWIEVLGGGVVHQQVLRNCGIDPEVYSGFAFGIGIERIAMLKYGINNMGLLFENDLRFLKQFKD